MTDLPTPLITVIIVNFNSGPLLKKCLEALREQTFPYYEVIIVDNGSEDDSLPALVDGLQCNIIRLTRNQGFAAANNIAAQKAKGTWLALLNPDAFPEAEWLETLVEATQRYPNTIMFGSTQISAENPLLMDGCGDIYHILGVPLRLGFRTPLTTLPEEREVFAPCAAAALVHKHSFLEAGGFDEQFFCYCEDVDLAFRLRLKGAHCMQIKKAIVHHVGSALSRSIPDFSIYYGTRNRIWVFIKNMPEPLFSLLLPFHFILHLLILGRAWRQGCLRPTWRGIIDAYRKLPAILNQRLLIQNQRTISVWSVMKSMEWNIKELIKRF